MEPLFGNPGGLHIALPQPVVDQFAEGTNQLKPSIIIKIKDTHLREALINVLNVNLQNQVLRTTLQITGCDKNTVLVLEVIAFLCE